MLVRLAPHRLVAPVPRLRSARSSLSQVRWTCSRASRAASHPGIETASAGIGEGAETPLEPDLLEWADLIVVMERAHRQRLTARFARHLKGKRIVCLDIPDKFAFMDAELVRLLKAKMAPLLKQGL